RRKEHVGAVEATLECHAADDEEQHDDPDKGNHPAHDALDGLGAACDAKVVEHPDEDGQTDGFPRRDKIKETGRRVLDIAFLEAKSWHGDGGFKEASCG